MTSKSAYLAASLVAVGGIFFLIFLMGAVGILGVEGDRADLMYLGVIAVAVGGAIVARLEPDRMALAMFVTAGATGMVGVIALLLGKQDAPGTPLPEIVGLTSMFASIFALSGWLYHLAAHHRLDEAERSPR